MKQLPAWEVLSTQVRDEWGTNKRLQKITWVSVLLFAVWSWVQLDEWRQSLAADAQAVSLKLQDARLASNEARWPERAAKAVGALENAKNDVWRARTEGEAEARLRDWLEQQARKNGVVIGRVTVSLDVPPRGMDVYPVRAELQGSYRAGAWQDFLGSLRKHRPKVVLEYDEINFANPRRPKYRANITAWFDLSSQKGEQ